MKCEELMTRDAVTLTEGQTLAEAARVFVNHRVSGAPVVDGEGRLVGILSERDILKHLKRVVDVNLGDKYLHDATQAMPLFVVLAEKGHVAAQDILQKLRTTPVGHVMTKKVIAAAPGDSVEHVAELMLEHDIDRVPIVVERRVVGIVSRSDFAKYVGQTLGEGR